MDDSILSSKNPDVIVHTFYSLVEDRDNISTVEPASSFLANVWSNAPELAAEVTERIIRFVGNEPRAAHAIVQTMLEVRDPVFLDLCYSISIKRSTPELARILIDSCLLFFQYEKVSHRIDDTLRKACRSFLKHQLDASVLLEIVRQVCIYERKELSTDILSMLSAVDSSTNTPSIHIIDRKSIEVIASGMAHGDSYLLQVIKDERSQIYEKEAAIFSLGCERRSDFYTYFNDWFEAFYGRLENTGICNEIVGSIVYSSSGHDMVRFLVEHLEQLRNARKIKGGFLNFGRRHIVATTKRLILGCTYCMCRDVRIEQELKYWLDNSDKSIQAFAVLALEKQGERCEEKENELKTELRSLRSFRSDCTLFTDLIMLRHCNMRYTVQRGSANPKHWFT